MIEFNPVPTVATGDIWSANLHNTYVRGNWIASLPDRFAAKGDLLIGSGIDAGDLLEIGATHSVLKLDSELDLGVEWGTSKSAGNNRSSYQQTGLIANTWHWMGWNSEDWDTHGGMSQVPNSYYTVPRSGYWLIPVLTRIECDSTNKWSVSDKFKIGLFVNDVLASEIDHYQVVVTNTDSHYLLGADILYLDLSDVVKIEFYWTGNTGLRAVIPSTTLSNHFQVVWLGDMN